MTPSSHQTVDWSALLVWTQGVVEGARVLLVGEGLRHARDGCLRKCLLQEVFQCGLGGLNSPKRSSVRKVIAISLRARGSGNCCRKGIVFPAVVVEEAEPVSPVPIMLVKGRRLICVQDCILGSKA